MNNPTTPQGEPISLPDMPKDERLSFGHTALAMEAYARAAVLADRAHRAASPDVAKAAQALVHFLDVRTQIELGDGEALLNDLREALGAAATQATLSEAEAFSQWAQINGCSTEENMQYVWAKSEDRAEWLATQARAAVGAEQGQGEPAVPLHPATRDLVEHFSHALMEKLAAAERKYGYSDGWAEPDWMDECRDKLMEHVAKGDPRDVAAYCAFLWHHGASTAGAKPSMQTIADLAGVFDEGIKQGASLSAKTPGEGWTPIESAPKDGVGMFVVCGFGVNYPEHGAHNYTTDAYCVFRSKGARCGLARWPHDFPPTHWMPLPKPPATPSKD